MKVFFVSIHEYLKRVNMPKKPKILRERLHPVQINPRYVTFIYVANYTFFGHRIRS